MKRPPEFTAREHHTMVARSKRWRIEPDQQRRDTIVYARPGFSPRLTVSYTATGRCRDAEARFVPAAGGPPITTYGPSKETRAWVLAALTDPRHEAWRIAVPEQ